MQAVVYNGPHDVSVAKVADLQIERPTDVIVRITTTNICGSDLHIYEGRTSFEKGRIFGHEVASTKATGGIGVVGVFVPEDPGAKDELAKQGKMRFDYGAFRFKGQKIGTGQANVKAYNRRLANLIHHGRANPSKIISHRLGLEEAPDAYKHFNARDEGWTKVVLKPAA